MGMTNEDPATSAPVYKQYKHVMYNRTLPAGRTFSMYFFERKGNERIFYRYVIFQAENPADGMLCLAEVRVYAQGIMTSLY